MSEERRSDVHERLNALGDRLTRLETLRESESTGQAMMAAQLIELTRAIQLLTTDMTILKTQRNTVIGAAAFIGSLLTVIGNAIFRAIMGGKS